MSGEKTAELGSELSDMFSDNNLNLTVLYDHEPINKRKKDWHAVPAYIREDGYPKRARSLSQIDIAIVNENKALVLCEIEEKGAVPKQMIGDVGNLLLADYIEFGSKEYSIDGAHIVFGFTPLNNNSEKQRTRNVTRQSEIKANLVKKRIEQRFGMSRMTIAVIFREDADDLKNAVKKYIFNYLTQNGKK